MKNQIKALFKRLGYIIVPKFLYRELADFIQDRAIDVVIDVGANFGQFGESLRAKGYKGRILSFEPVAASFQVLSKKAAGDPKWEVQHCGLGAAAGEAVINVSEASDFSSILKPSWTPPPNSTNLLRLREQKPSPSRPWTKWLQD